MTKPSDNAESPRSEPEAKLGDTFGRLYVVRAICPQTGIVRFDPTIRVEIVPEQREEGAP